MRAFWGRSALHTPYSNSILRSRKPQKVLGYIYLLIMPFALFEVGKDDCMSFPYFYGRAAEQYAFYRIPKLLFSDERFEALSTDAKLLYGMLIDRMELSMKNGWTDKDGRVFIYFTLEDARERLKCGTEKIVKLFAELDSEKGIGLIECVRQGLGKPNIIYVKNFMDDTSLYDW